MTVKLYAFTCGTVTGEFAHLMEGGEGDITVPIPASPTRNRCDLWCRRYLAATSQLAAPVRNQYHASPVAKEQGVRDIFEGRLLALAKAHHLLSRESWDGVGLRSVTIRYHSRLASMTAGKPVLRSRAATFASRPKLRRHLPKCHELATNAAKYGSLSTFLRSRWQHHFANLAPSMAYTIDPAGSNPETADRRSASSDPVYPDD
jgi:HWE histidine kinase